MYGARMNFPASAAQRSRRGNPFLSDHPPGSPQGDRMIRRGVALAGERFPRHPFYFRAFLLYWMWARLAQTKTPIDR